MVLEELRATDDPLAPMTVARRATQGGLALLTRQVLVFGANILGGVLLARVLTPAEFGLYAITAFLISFLAVFGDVGLGASLIRQASEPDVADFRAVFTAQQILVVAVVGLLWAAAPWLADAYRMPPDDAWLFRIAALSLVVASLQTMPIVRLERSLRFDRLATIETTQAVVFNVVAVALAYSGFGAWSYAYAALAAESIGALLANLVSPWRIGWALDVPRIRHHLSFGLPYQGSSVVSLIKDSITPVLIGLLLGAAAVGYINWAQMVAAYAVIVLQPLARLYLPMFARLQAQPDALRSALERSIQLTNAIVAPLAIVTLVLARPITLAVFGERWLPALPYFYLLWAANLLVPTVSPMLGALNGKGRSGLTFMFTVIWMVGTWALGAPLVLTLGAIGFPVANAVVQLTNVPIILFVRRQIPVRLLRSIAPAWVAAGVAGVGLLFIQATTQASGVVLLAVEAALAVACYLVIMVSAFPGEVRQVWRLLHAES